MRGLCGLVNCLWFLVLLLLALVEAESNVGGNNSRPVVGILTVPTQRQCVDEPAAAGSEALGPPAADFMCYIPAGYVKLVEMGAARVVLLPCYAGDKLRSQMSQVNGFVWGGMYTDFQCKDASPYALTQYGKAAKMIYDYVVEQNRLGVHLPLFSECKGFNMLTFFVANVPHWTDIILDNISSVDQPAPISWNLLSDYTKSAIYKSAQWLGAVELLTNGPNVGTNCVRAPVLVANKCP